MGTRDSRETAPSNGAARTMAGPLGDDRVLFDLHASEQYLLWLAAADEMGLFTTLAATPATAEEVATTLSMGVVTAEGLLGVLAALGFLVQYDHRFSLTQTARDFLLPSSPYYRGPWLEAVRRRPRVTYDQVSAALRDSRPLHLHPWAPDDTEPITSEILVRGVHSLLAASGPTLAVRGDFSSVQHVLDVGGGAGGMSIALALQYPHLHCTVLDNQVACGIAGEYIAAHGVAGQVDTLALDALADPWPAGYDAVLLSHVLDCFGEQECLRLLHKAHACLPLGGRLYVHEMPLADAKDGPLGVVALSLHDHLWTRGQQWTGKELKTMIAQAGFVEVSLLPAYGYNVVLCATKP